MKNCAHCGCVNDSVNRYCRNCGVRFAEDAPEKQQGAAEDAKADSIFGIDETGAWERGLPGGKLAQAVKPEEDRPLQEPRAAAPAMQPTRPVIDFDFMDQKEQPREEPVNLAPFRFGQREGDASAVIQMLKKSGASLGTFWFCLFFTVYLGLAIWSAVVSLDPNDVNLLVTGYEQSASALDQSVITGLLIGGRLLWLVPSLLTMIGMWFFYGACLTRRRPYVKTSGLGVVFSGAIVQICLLSLGVLFGIVGVAALLIQVWDVQSIKVAGGMALILVMAVLLMAAVVLRILYSAKLLKLIRRVRRTAATGEPDAKGSIFIVVMNFLWVLGSAPLVGVYMAAGNFIRMSGTIAYMLALIFISVGLLRYREGMKNIMYRREHPLPDKTGLSDWMGM